MSPTTHFVGRFAIAAKVLTFSCSCVMGAVHSAALA
eukprot:CAMPEP_0198681360 /NCGR_PEP_ID=MMETSP1468-20131203/6678_1 /TAXON_ID=1461545 /ORGANISM="Mantoniella sp, Strain CCMP1436" /LENGTH=35 /DNA_ID= /DNA_START= /DNA_END= /DNA_ORIENTATION=